MLSEQDSNLRPNLYRIGRANKSDSLPIAVIENDAYGTM